MYPNLRAEMARRDISIKDIASLLNCSVSTVYAKMSAEDKTEFTLSEADIIKNALNEKLPFENTSDLMDYLFNHVPEAR